MPEHKILVVDDDIENCKLLQEVLVKDSYAVTIATSGEDAVKLGKESPFDIVLSDIRMFNMDGLALLRSFKQFSPQTIVILMTAFGSLKTALEAMNDGAFDYISKPFKLEEIKNTISRALEQKVLLSSGKSLGLKAGKDLEYDPSNIIGKSKAMTEIYKMVALAAGTNATVLIQGESGTGKELIARAIHFNSDRKTSPFVAINCVSLPESLLESELFGHKKGAFTGAVSDNIGLLESAKHGTIFLDEIGDTTATFQAKLLRVLEEQEIRHIGGTENIKIDVRIISATNSKLEEKVKAKEFRQDLFYRLNVITINILPLRERPEDIPPLIEYFLKKYSNRHDREISAISPEVMDILNSYPWPGNVRELEHTIERAVALTTGAVITQSDLPSNLVETKGAPSSQQTLDGLEKNYMLEILRQTKGNRSKTADILGINRKTLYRKALKYGIDIDSFS